jgi:hypothetical protein
LRDVSRIERARWERGADEGDGMGWVVDWRLLVESNENGIENSSQSPTMKVDKLDPA